MQQKVKTGDIFLVPIVESIFGVGQVVDDWKGELYLVIYDDIIKSRNIDLNPIIVRRPLFAALSLDAKIYNGDWMVIANIVNNLSNIPQPFYKVKYGSKVFVESRDRSVTRLAEEGEENFLKFRTIVSPIRLENALKAANGFAEWDVRFDELLADYAYKSSAAIHGRSK